MTVLGIIGIVIGMVVFVYGWGSAPKKFILSGGGILLLFGGALVVLGVNPTRDYPDGNTTYLAIGICGMIAGAVLSIFAGKKVSANVKTVRTEKLLEIGGTNLDKFFVECVLASCNDFSQEKNVEKAKLLADKYRLKYPNGIKALYESGLEAHQVISSRIDSVRLEEIRNAEKAEYDRLNKYSHLYGKDKRNAMLTDRMNELRESAKTLDKGAELLMRSGQQQEINWATWGGIANGLAGPAAGLATAADMQARNAQIRAENELRRKNAMPAYMLVTNSASQNRSRADEIEEELQLLKEKLIVDTPADDVMKMLSVSNATADVSETGACIITATVSAKSDLFIFDDVPAVADGSIIAHIIEDGNEIGTASMVFPVNGVTSSTGIAGIMLSGAHKEKKQTVTFNAGKLWLMEK